MAPEAAATATSRAAREPHAPFTTTRRWLRGRILDRLREAEGERWTTFDGPIGEHGPLAVEAVLRTLASEGMVELAERGATDASERPAVPLLRARLPAR
jgi:hypothetical protein